jgi:bacteriocin-like protein
MKNFVKLSAIKLNENEMKQIIGGDGSQQKRQGPPQPIVRYAIVPLYGIVVAKVD